MNLDQVTWIQPWMSEVNERHVNMIFASDIDHMRRPWPIFRFGLVEPIESNHEKIHGMMNTVGETIVSWKKVHMGYGS